MLLQREADELAAEQRKQRQLQRAQLKELELQREAERQRELELLRQQQEAIRLRVLVSVFYRYSRSFMLLQIEADERAAVEERIKQQVHPIAQLYAAIRCLHMCTRFCVLPILQKFHAFAERG